MKTLSRILLSLGCLLDTSQTYARDGSSPLILGYEHQEVEIDQLTVVGSGGTDIFEARILIDSRVDGKRYYKISLTKNGNVIGVVYIEQETLPNLDLASTRLYALDRKITEGLYRSVDGAAVRIRFGDRSNCFSNDDGRPIYTLELGRGFPDPIDSYITSFKDCIVEYADVEVVNPSLK